MATDLFLEMDRKANGLFINSKRVFSPIGNLKQATIIKVLDFSYNMTFAGSGEHRNHRSGGTHIRRNGEIFANTFQGKLAECALYNELVRIGYEPSYPDFSVYELGKWDDVDIEVKGKSISIKSTKAFGNLLLLETKDWDNNGRYLPNDKSYDFTFLIRMDPYCEDILRKSRLLYTDTIEKARLEEILLGQDWKYDIAGFVTNDELIEIIRNNHIIRKGDMLNGTTPMDADNYYIQSGSMHKISEFKI